MDGRAEIFDAFRRHGREGLFSDPVNIEMLDNLCDAFGVAKAGALDLNALFARIRSVTGPLNQDQVNIVNAILTATDGMDARDRAYILATAWHEARFKPQPEWGRGGSHPYAKPGKYGQPQYGRGLAQLTWDRNYEWADRALGLGGALLKDFDLALDPEISVRILVKGMVDGAFTGKKLADYPDFLNKRRVVNGMDKAALIAGIAEKFI